MNDVVATALAIGLIYVVLKFAFGGPSSSSGNSSGTHHEPIPLHEQERRQQQAAVRVQEQQQSSASSASSSAAKRGNLISRYGLESRINDGASSGSEVVDVTTPAVQSLPTKGKGKASSQTEDEWKKGADKRKDDLRKRREEMILEARRKLLEKQQNRAAVDGA